MKKLVLLALVAIVATTSAFASGMPFGPPPGGDRPFYGPKIDSELDAKLSLARRGQTFTVIVTVADPDIELPPSMPQAERNKKMAAAMRKQFAPLKAVVTQNGGVVHNTMDHIGVMVVTGPAKAIRALAKRATVTTIREERVMTIN